MVLEISFVIALTVGVIALFWLIVRNSSDKIVHQYRKMAQQLELSVTEPQARLAGFVRSEPFIHGIYRHREMSISVPAKGLQNTRQIETVVKIKVNSGTFTWQVTSTGLIGRLRQLDSGTKSRWNSGDPVFDAMVDVRTSDEGRFGRIFDEARRSVVLNILRGSKGSIKLRGDVLSFEEFGLIADDPTRERYMEITEVLCQLAEVVEGR